MGSGLDSLQISIDGSTAETYERIRVRAHFDRVVANVERILASRRRLRSETPRLRLVMVMMRRNLHELPDLVRFAHRYSIESIFVQHLCHDFGEATLPEQYLPMRDFVQRETLLEEDPRRIDHYFGEARKVAQELRMCAGLARYIRGFSNKKKVDLHNTPVEIDRPPSSFFRRRTGKNGVV